VPRAAVAGLRSLVLLAAAVLALAIAATVVWQRRTAAACEL
jgi:hypothetical protein